MEEPREGLRRGVTGLICDERGKRILPRLAHLSQHCPTAFPGINPERSVLSLCTYTAEYPGEERRA